MKFFDHTDLWSVGWHLLLTFAFFIFLILLRDFSWKTSAAIAGGIVALGFATMIYISVRCAKEKKAKKDKTKQ